VKNGNCRNTPVEIFETRFPLRVLEYSLIDDSGGPGAHRGGLGTQRVFEVEEDTEVTVNALLDRTKPGFGAWGLADGKSGELAAILVKRKGESEFRTFTEVFGTASASKFTNIRLQSGDQVVLRSPGGGGYGDPAERSEELVREDIAQGFVSEERARSAYGWSG